MPSALVVGSGEVATAVVACEGTLDVAVFEEVWDKVFSLKVSFVGEVGDLTSGPLESLVFFFLRRPPKVGIFAG